VLEVNTNVIRRAELLHLYCRESGGCQANLSLRDDAAHVLGAPQKSGVDCPADTSGYKKVEPHFA
jgi:hypothetical protein